LLEVAMELDADAIIPACELAYQYLMEADRKAEAQSYIERAQRLCQTNANQVEIVIPGCR
jgi:hypothetical protein